MKLEEIRRDYLRGSLDRKHLRDDPVQQFNDWLEDALNAGIQDANAMTLATADAYGKPSARIVLLKGFDKDGFRFFTNFSSRKGAHLEVNNFGALLFYWPQLERQVRIEGTVTEISAEVSRAYFNERSYESRVSALTSPQSQPIPDREYLVRRVDEAIK
ncbi:MAG: pyridoxal 5'-phosphate synthase, partial [Bacteroidales bacterium]|nr:pyridoxal 5'-phosphate synthase [Bacteroidales bacterium]